MALTKFNHQALNADIVWGDLYPKIHYQDTWSSLGYPSVRSYVTEYYRNIDLTEEEQQEIAELYEEMMAQLNATGRYNATYEYGDRRKRCLRVVPREEEALIPLENAKETFNEVIEICESIAAPAGWELLGKGENESIGMRGGPYVMYIQILISPPEFLSFGSSRKPIK